MPANRSALGYPSAATTNVDFALQHERPRAIQNSHAATRVVLPSADVRKVLHKDARPAARSIHTAAHATFEILLKPFERLGKSGKHLTVSRHWDSFSKFVGLDNEDNCTFVPSEDQLREFAGYLLSLGTCGGASVKSYLILLPAALAGKFGLRAPNFTLPRSIRIVSDMIARELPAVTPLVRGAATLHVIQAVYQDSSINPAVRAAIVVQYHLGFRGINVYITKKGSQERALRWADCTLRDSGPSRFWSVRVRMEKTAAVHTGTFPDKLLVSSVHSNMPCPVTAMDSMFSEAIKDHIESRAVFPGVTYRHVSTALAKHSSNGEKLSPHSIRIGAATDINSAGLTERTLQAKGNWATPQSANKYVRASVQSNVREMAAVAQAAESAMLLPKAPLGGAGKMSALTAATSVVTRASSSDHAAAPSAGRSFLPTRRAQISLHGNVQHDTTSNILILLLNTKKGQWRGYFYDAQTHLRRLKSRHNDHYLGHYEPFLDKQLPRLLAKTLPFCELKIADLLADYMAALDAPTQYFTLRNRINPRGRDASL